jgi:hypothetical protein
MNFVEFGSQMDRLKQTFGEKSYPEERVRLLWSDYGHVPIGVFSDGISKLIKEKRYAPLGDELRDVFSYFSSGSRREEKIKAIKEKGRCGICDDTGSVIKECNDRVFRAARCSCDLGEAGLCLPGEIARI